MRLLTLKLLRRSLRLPPPPLRYFFSRFSSCSSPHSLFSSSLHYRHQNDYISNPCCWSNSISRRFSVQPDFSDLDDPSFPVSTLISLLDSYHDLTGFPWWIIISSSTVAMRLTLAPLTIMQIKKINKIGEMLPKLPRPFPPPLSGRSIRDQFSLFLKEKKAAGCPSFFWFFASFVVQAPCFLLWIMSIRAMSLSHHSGFDCGGILWFQNLTEYPNGLLGPILPLAVAGLHVTNIQLSFKSSLQQLPGTLGLLAKLYKMYLQLITLPIMFTAFNVPQGSLVYWVTNSSLSIVQILCLRRPDVLEYLGLPMRNTPTIAPINVEGGNIGVPDTFIQTKQGRFPAQSLSPLQLVNLSIPAVTDGRMDIAMKLLRIAVEKDPEHVRAWIIMGQALLNTQQFAEAAECLESAISKLLLVNHPSEDEVDYLILSSQWAGMAYMKQGKTKEGLSHLERIAEIEEPADLKVKAHYYDGLFKLSSALLIVDRKDEGLNYLEKIAAYDPAYKEYFKQVESNVEDFSSNLANNRREF